MSKMMNIGAPHGCFCNYTKEADSAMVPQEQFNPLIVRNSAAQTVRESGKRLVR
jgi:hypothetical protein